MRAGQVRLPIRAWRMAPRISFAPKNPHPHAMSKRHQHTAQRNPFATDGSHPTTHAAELRSIVCFWFSFKSGVYVAARSGLHFHENSVHEERGRRASAKLCWGRSREFSPVLHEWCAVKSIISRNLGSRYKAWSTPFDRRRHVTDVGRCQGKLQLAGSHKMFML